MERGTRGRLAGADRAALRDRGVEGREGVEGVAAFDSLTQRICVLCIE
jgi:hypothetical protein